jgi:radical SAM superfamily enzyme YgiQ (UPF0313 family)
VLEELRLLKKLGIREIHFRDQTFGVDKVRTALLLEELNRLHIGWSCFCKADLFTEESARAYKRAGCHTVIFGIESGVARMREEYGKRLNDSDIKSALHICSRNRIDTAGTFIIGLPGETEEDLSQTMAFARSLPLDYASFNIAAPRPGTKLRAGQAFASARFPEYERLQQAVDLANRSFYLRPAYIGRRIAKIASPSVLLREARVGLRLLRGK